MGHITNEVRIAAPVERVWNLTVDVEGWPALTPTVTSVERLDPEKLQVGSQARVVQPWQRPAVWTVTDLEPRSLFAWETKVGTVRMRGIHRLRPSARGTVNTLAVELDGFGSGLMARLVGRKIREAIATENAGFKAAAERVDAPV